MDKYVRGAVIIVHLKVLARARMTNWPGYNFLPRIDLLVRMIDTRENSTRIFMAWQ